jgi:hypothetical protein
MRKVVEENKGSNYISSSAEVKEHSTAPTWRGAVFESTLYGATFINVSSKYSIAQYTILTSISQIAKTPKDLNEELSSSLVSPQDIWKKCESSKSPEELKKKVEKWKKRMLENPPPEPELSSSAEEWDYYDEEYAWRKLGLLS